MYKDYVSFKTSIEHTQVKLLSVHHVFNMIPILLLDLFRTKLHACNNFMKGVWLIMVLSSVNTTGFPEWGYGLSVTKTQRKKSHGLMSGL
jgi:hypothetical protein